MILSQGTAAVVTTLMLHGLACGTAAAAPLLLAGRGLGSDPQQAIVLSVRSLATPGLKLAHGVLTHPDGDRLAGGFRIYCPTRMIRTVNDQLIAADGAIRKQGAWWEPAFQPRWRTEQDLVGYVCRVGDF